MVRVRFGVRFRVRVRVRPFSRSREVRFWTRPSEDLCFEGND